jgi:hypothetical protein
MSPAGWRPFSGLGRFPLASRHYRAGLSRNSASRLETNLQYSSSPVKLEESQFTYLTAAKASLNRALNAALKCVRENRLVFGKEIRHVRRYVTISGVQTGSSLSAAAQRERRVGRGPSEYVSARVVEGVDLREFENADSDEGGELYAPSLMLKVWFYVYALGMTSARRLEQRIREDLGLRYLAGGQRPDIWALSALRRRHGRAAERRVYASGGDGTGVGVGAFGNGAIDSMRVRACASRDRIDTEQRLRNERAKIRRWQKPATAAIRRKARECGWRWRIWNGGWRTSRKA